MRRAANASVARLSASTAAASARWSAPSRAARTRRERRVDRVALARVEQVAVVRERALGRVERCGRPRPAPRPARAPSCRRRHARTNPAACARSRRRDRPYDGFTVIVASTPVVCSRAVTDEQAVGVDLERDADARGARRPSAECRAARSARASGSRRPSRARPARTWIAIAVWPSLNVVNSCARATGMVELRGMIFSVRPPIVSRPSDSGMTSSSSQSSSRVAVAGELVGLDRRAERHDLVGIEVVQRRLAEELADRAPHLRHARRAADQHHALDVAPARASRRAARGAPAAASSAPACA